MFDKKVVEVEAVKKQQEFTVVRVAAVEYQDALYGIVSTGDTAWAIPLRDLKGLGLNQTFSGEVANDWIECYNFNNRVLSAKIPHDRAQLMRNLFWQSGGITKDDAMRGEILDVIQHLLPVNLPKSVVEDSNA